MPFIGADFDSYTPNPAMERFYLRMGLREIARDGCGSGIKARSRQLLDVAHKSTVLPGWLARAQDGAASVARCRRWVPSTASTHSPRKALCSIGQRLGGP